MNDKTRNIERTIVIDAEPDVVWRALTEARELMRWFPPHAEVQPGVGGTIDLTWDPAEATTPCRVIEWEPGQHLRMSWRDEPDGEHPLPVDIRLESRDGRTVLRLVHSGFLTDASWDDDFESHGRGWSYELRSLKYYLEHYFGRDRHVLRMRFPITGDAKETWRSLVGEQGLFRVSTLSTLAEGADFMLQLPSGDFTSARMFHQLADHDFAAIADVLQGGIFRFALETTFGQPEVWIWLLSWHLVESQLEGLMDRWVQDITETLGSPSLETQSGKLNI